MKSETIMKSEGGSSPLAMVNGQWSMGKAIQFFII